MISSNLADHKAGNMLCPHWTWHRTKALSLTGWVKTQVINPPHSNRQTSNPMGLDKYLKAETSVPCSLVGLVCVPSLKDFLGSFLVTEVLYLHGLVLKLNAICYSDLFAKKLQACGLHVALSLEAVQQIGNPYSLKCKATFSLGS